VADECGLKTSLLYYEVSCWSLENIPEVQNAIFTSALGHAYMGEKLPKSYIIVENALKELRVGRADLPIVDTQLVAEQCKSYMLLDISVVQRALNLLTLWGECVYFDHPEELASTVVLEPKFLTKEVLGQLFNPRLVFFYKNGIIKHSSLVHIWSAFKDRKDFIPVSMKLMALMQRFEVCFQLEEESPPAEGASALVTSESVGGTLKKASDLFIPAAKDQAVFFNLSSIIPSLLPVKPPPSQSLDSLSKEEREKLDLFQSLWPQDLPHNQKVQVERVLRFNVVPAELVARLLVRLHTHIQKQLIWRHDVVIFKDKTQAWIQVDPSSNRFLVNLRGSNRERCCHLMDYIVQEVETVAANYSGVLWTQAIRSPHHSGTLIDLSDALTDMARDPEQRTLVCPETLLPIRAEGLLKAAGLIEAEAKEKPLPNWWHFPVTKAPGERENLEKISVVEHGEIQDQELFEKLSALLTHFHANPDHVTKAYALDNQTLRNAFEASRQNISQRHKDSPSLFKKEDWRDTEEFELRRSFILHLNEMAAKFRMRSWNDGAKLFVVPTIQGTMEDAAWKIAENGFGTVATRDLGYFGKGIYFTSDFDYASNYTKPTAEGDSLFLVSLVIPGNPYPITEPPFLSHNRDNPTGFYGKTCQSGYQSHYTLSESRLLSSLLCFLFSPNIDDDNHHNSWPQARPRLIPYQEAVQPQDGC